MEFQDLAYGSSAARTVTLRFGVRSSVAGNFVVSLRNSLLNRSYPTTFTIAANEVNTDLLRTITIPGDTTGSWSHCFVTVSLCSGSALNGTVNTWNGSNRASVAGATNLWATAGATFELFDVGLYEGRTAPQYELQPYDLELMRCMRFFQNGTLTVYRFALIASYRGSITERLLPVQMRDDPAVTGNVTSGKINYLTGSERNAVIGDVVLACTKSRLRGTISGNADPGAVGDYIDLDFTLDARI